MTYYKKTESAAVTMKRAKLVRDGAGVRRSGQVAMRHILDTAHAMLRKRNRQLTMRGIAEQAGIRLSNLQHYFPALDQLVSALLLDIGSRYREAHQECVNCAGSDPVARFQAVMAFCVSDLHLSSTRSYFLQIWALLDTLDAGKNRRLSELYEMDIAQLSERIAELDPRSSPVSVRRRATLLAAMIEGLMVVQGAHSGDKQENRYLVEQAQVLGLSIALGRHDSVDQRRAGRDSSRTEPG